MQTGGSKSLISRCGEGIFRYMEKRWLGHLRPMDYDAR